eukprot:4482508-Amphidinium_carterae.1
MGAHAQFANEEEALGSDPAHARKHRTQATRMSNADSRNQDYPINQHNLMRSPSQPHAFTITGGTSNQNLQ